MAIRKRVTAPTLRKRLQRLYLDIRVASDSIHKCEEVDASRGTPWAHTIAEIDHLAPLIRARLLDLDNGHNYTQSP